MAQPPLNRPENGVRIRLPSGRVVTGRELAGPARDSSTHSLHIAMVLGAGLLLAGAAVNGVGIRNPSPKTEEDVKEVEAALEADHLGEEPEHEEVGVGVAVGSAHHEEFHARGDPHHHHLCTFPPTAGSGVASSDEAVEAT